MRKMRQGEGIKLVQFVPLISGEYGNQTKVVQCQVHVLILNYLVSSTFAGTRRDLLGFLTALPLKQGSKWEITGKYR